MKIAIVDDNLGDIEAIEANLEEYSNAYHIEFQIFKFFSAEQFLQTIESTLYDIVFFDIYMEELTGIEAAKVFRKHDNNCKIIFITSSMEFLRAGYSVNASHYLIKPFSVDDFLEAMENCMLTPKYEVANLKVTIDGIERSLDTRKIIYTDFYNRAVRIHLEDEKLVVKANFAEISNILLTDKRFLAIIKGIVLNMDYISQHENDIFIMRNGDKLPINIRNKKKVISDYMNYMFEKRR